MATIETVYLGGLRTEATHIQSGNRITTDAPTDNNGRGEFFSPTDMVAAALGSCMLTIMDLAAQRLGVDISGTRLEIQKVMASDPRRICEIAIDFRMPATYDDKTRRILENAAHTCPVSKSLHPDLKQTIRFHYL
ncbi:MAG: OsmC family protein [Rikenellaceae bacterium]|nr:OsmC family protein [Rikenellaceae bacterium]